MKLQVGRMSRMILVPKISLFDLNIFIAIIKEGGLSEKEMSEKAFIRKV